MVEPKAKRQKTKATAPEKDEEGKEAEEEVAEAGEDAVDDNDEEAEAEADADEDEPAEATAKTGGPAEAAKKNKKDVVPKEDDLAEVEDAENDDKENWMKSFVSWDSKNGEVRRGFFLLAKDRNRWFQWYVQQ